MKLKIDVPEIKMSFELKATPKLVQRCSYSFFSAFALEKGTLPPGGDSICHNPRPAHRWTRLGYRNELCSRCSGSGLQVKRSYNINNPSNRQKNASRQTQVYRRSFFLFSILPLCISKPKN